MEFIADSEASRETTDSVKLDVPINEYYELVLHEYNNERGRKQSIESRSGILLSLETAFFAIIFDKKILSNIFSLFSQPLTFISLIEILTGLAFYVFFFISILFSLLSLKIKSYAFYNVSRITTAALMAKRVPAVGQIILDIVEAIGINRQENEKKAKYFNNSIICIVICIACLFIYKTITGGK